MNQDLAKKLKDAGFPQKQTVVDFDENKTIEGGKGESVSVDHEIIYIPSLSELIEECGSTFTTLEKLRDGRWQAICGHPHKDGYLADFIGHGSTPEEAVVNLWLEINKK